MGNALHTPGAPGVGAVSPADARLDDAGLLAVHGPGLLDTRTGVLYGPGTTALIAGTADTAPMTVQIAAHHWVTTRGAGDGVYRGAAETTKTVDIAAAPASGSRIDVVYVKQNDAYSTITPDATTEPVYGAVTGTVGAGEPALPVGALKLGTVTVAAGATATNGAGVTIANTALQTVARGARIPVRDQAERDAITPFAGLEVYRRDTGRVEVRNHLNTAWLTLFDPAPVVTEQAGRVAATFSASNQASGTTVFPTPFAAGATPRVQLTPEVPAGSSVDLVATLTSEPTDTQFTWRVRERSATAVTVNAFLHWQAKL